MELKTYRIKPKIIKAAHVKKTGTYTLFGIKVEMKADMYAFMKGGNLMTLTGEEFRDTWELTDE